MTASSFQLGVVNSILAFFSINRPKHEPTRPSNHTVPKSLILRLATFWALSYTADVPPPLGRTNGKIGRWRGGTLFESKTKCLLDSEHVNCRRFSRHCVVSYAVIERPPPKFRSTTGTRRPPRATMLVLEGTKTTSKGYAIYKQWQSVNKGHLASKLLWLKMIKLVFLLRLVIAAIPSPIHISCSGVVGVACLCSLENASKRSRGAHGMKGSIQVVRVRCGLAVRMASCTRQRSIVPI